MTFEDWWEENGKSIIKFQLDYKQTAELAWNAALAEGRKERTVEIAEAWGYADVGLHDNDLEDELKRVYPECFKGEKT